MSILSMGGWLLESNFPGLPFYSVLDFTDWGRDLSGARFVLLFADTWQRAAEVTSLIRPLDGLATMFPFFDDGTFNAALQNRQRKLSADGFWDINYWANLVDGFQCFKADARLSEENPYWRELVNQLTRSSLDPALLSKLLDKSKIAEVALRRFSDFERISEGNVSSVAPMTLYIPGAAMPDYLRSSRPDILLTNDTLKITMGSTDTIGCLFVVFTGSFKRKSSAGFTLVKPKFIDP